MKKQKIESTETYDVVWAAYLMKHGYEVIHSKVEGIPSVLFTMEGQGLKNHRNSFRILTLDEYKNLNSKILELQEIARNQLSYIYGTPDYSNNSSEFKAEMISERKQYAANS